MSGTISNRATRGEIFCSRATIATVAVNVSVQIPVHAAARISVEPIVKISSAHPENIGSACLVSSCMHQSPDDELALHLAGRGTELNNELRFRTMLGHGVGGQVPADSSLDEHLMTARWMTFRNSRTLPGQL